MRLLAQPVHPFHPDLLNKLRRSARNTSDDLEATPDPDRHRDLQIAQVLIDEHLLLRCAERHKHHVGPRCSDFAKNRRQALLPLFEAKRRTCNSRNFEAWISPFKQLGQESARSRASSQQKHAQSAARAAPADFFNNLHARNALNSLPGEQARRHSDWEPIGARHLRTPKAILKYGISFSKKIKLCVNRGYDTGTVSMKGFVNDAIDEIVARYCIDLDWAKRDARIRQSFIFCVMPKRRIHGLVFRDPRTGCINVARRARELPSGAKARILCVSDGTAEAAPFQNSIYATSSRLDDFYGLLN